MRAFHHWLQKGAPIFFLSPRSLRECARTAAFASDRPSLSKRRSSKCRWSCSARWPSETSARPPSAAMMPWSGSVLSYPAMVTQLGSRTRRSQHAMLTSHSLLSPPCCSERGGGARARSGGADAGARGLAPRPRRVGVLEGRHPGARRRAAPAYSTSRLPPPPRLHARHPDLAYVAGATGEIRYRPLNTPLRFALRQPACRDNDAFVWGREGRGSEKRGGHLLVSGVSVPVGRTRVPACCSPTVLSGL